MKWHCENCGDETRHRFIELKEDGRAEYQCCAHRDEDCTRILLPMPEVVAGDYYRHKKGGLYSVMGLGKNSESQEPMVCYVHHDTLEMWMRPQVMWTPDRFAKARWWKMERLHNSLFIFDEEYNDTLPPLDGTMIHAVRKGDKYIVVSGLHRAASLLDTFVDVMVLQ